MFLARVNKKNTVLRHILVATIAILIALLFVLIRADFSVQSKVSRGLAESSLMLLIFTMIIGPLSRLYPPAIKLITWRRETGVWFTIVAFLHFLASNLNNFAIFRQGREVPMLLGYIGLFWGIILTAVSSDKAISFLGSRQWKWLQSMAYVVLYVVLVHSAFNIFWTYQDQAWLPYFFITLAVAVPVLQITAFVDEVGKYRGRMKRGLPDN